MGTTQDYALFAVGQMEGAGPVTFRKMMGEYVVYLEGKVVALVCDNNLFIKPTEAGRKVIERLTASPAAVAPPFPGAKGWFVIGDKIEDRDFLTELLRAGYKELPLPKPRKSRSKGKK